MKIKYINDNRTTYIDKMIVNNHLIPIIRYNIFKNEKDLVTGFSTRLGGVSKNHLASLNLSSSRGDARENVLINLQLFGEAVGFDYTRLVFSDQIHDTQIKIVTEDDAGKWMEGKTDIVGIDALITTEKNIPMMTFYADCVPLYIYDRKKKIIGLAHSGWKGTVNKIGTKVVNTMVEKYGSNPNDILCAIGPSICRACYEVSEDVALKFKDAYEDYCYRSMIDDNGNGKYQLDLHLACYYNFIEAGINHDNIAMPDICTACNPKLLFSHRKTNGMRGNLAAVAMLV